MKFAIINDSHIGPTGTGYFKGVQRKLVSEAERLIEEFIERMNVQDNPEFVVNLGDSIEDVNDKAVDIQSFLKAQSLFSKLVMPTYTLIGNHDIRTLSENEISEILGYERMYYSFDHGSYHFVALSFEMTGDHTKVTGAITANVPKKQIKWLKTELSKTKKPVIVFIHYPLAEDDMKGNFWFESEKHNALIGNRKQVREVLEESKNVKAVFSAHQHWNRMHIHNGIPYFVITSLVENFESEGIPAEAHAIVEINKNKITVDVRGNDSAQFSFDFP